MDKKVKNIVSKDINNALTQFFYYCLSGGALLLAILGFYCWLTVRNNGFEIITLFIISLLLFLLARAKGEILTLNNKVLKLGYSTNSRESFLELLAEDLGN